MRQLLRNSRDQERRLRLILSRIRSAVVCALGQARLAGALADVPLPFGAAPAACALLRDSRTTARLAGALADVPLPFGAAPAACALLRDSRTTARLAGALADVPLPFGAAPAACALLRDSRTTARLAGALADVPLPFGAAPAACALLRDSRTTARLAGALADVPLPFGAAPAACALLRSIFLVFVTVILSFGQEGGRGIDVRATITGQAAFAGQLSDAPRQGSGMAAGVRAVLYPTIKLSEHWSVSGAVQAVSRPYYQEDFTSIGNGVRARILQGNVSYTRVWNGGALVVRAGQVMSAFGSFLLRYDDADNPLTGAPQTYGYYKPVSTIGMTGAEADVTMGRVDARLQFTTSSSVNPRSVFARDQYANWAGGAGYTIRQGLRVGWSGYHGPYLSRNLPYYFPGEAKPRDLPANGVGIDGDWAIGHWNIRGEWQRFVLPYRAIPTFTQTAGYVEVQRVLHPRWFVAVRAGKLHSNFLSGGEEWSGSVGFRPNVYQIVKTGFIGTHSELNGRFDPVFIVQMTTAIHPLALAWK